MPLLTFLPASRRPLSAGRLLLLPILLAFFIDACAFAIHQHSGVVSDFHKSHNVRVIIVPGDDNSRKIEPMVKEVSETVLRAVGFNVITTDSPEVDFTIRINFKLEGLGHYWQTYQSQGSAPATPVGKPYFSPEEWRLSGDFLFYGGKKPTQRGDFYPFYPGAKPYSGSLGASATYAASKEALAKLAWKGVGPALLRECARLGGVKLIEPLTASGDPNLKAAAQTVVQAFKEEPGRDKKDKRRKKNKELGVFRGW
jgi:hypothetical protein